MLLFLPTVKWSLLFYFTLVSYPMLTGAVFPVDDILDEMKKVVIDPIEDFIQDALKNDITGIGKVADFAEVPDMLAKPGCLPWINCPMKSVPTMRSLTLTDLSGDITSLTSDMGVDITSLTSDVLGVKETADSIKELAKKIPEIVKIVRVFMSNPVGTLGVRNEVASLASTLERCLNKMTELVDPKQAFDSVLHITGIDSNIIGGIPDIPDLTYKVLAFMLLPFKPAIEFSCDKVLPIGISMLKTAVQKIIGRRRRRMAKKQIPPELKRCPKSTSGDNIFCESEHISYFYDNTSNVMYRSMVDELFVFGDDLIPNPRDNSDTEVVQEIRSGRFTFQLVATIVDDLCEVLGKCLPDVAGCNPGIACGVVKIIYHVIVDVLDYVLGSADLQDAEINNFRLRAIFNDRISIIHNQKLILDTIKKSVVGTTTQIQNSENIEIYSLKKISEQIDDLKSGSAAKTEAGKFVMDGKENEGEIMIIKLKSIHLYYGIIIFVSGIIIGMFIGMFIGKFCCNGYNKSNVGFAPVPKYDYSTTDIDIDDENK